ncbi:hypothetical protein RhiJN_26517 [Ceratobasidium sp. AG-Ba]|nr:hypothetical protein RhiJN_26517 [Ceratobasidium sp. AG-Ba]
MDIDEPSEHTAGPSTTANNKRDRGRASLSTNAGSNAAPEAQRLRIEQMEEDLRKMDGGNRRTGKAKAPNQKSKTGSTMKSDGQNKPENPLGTSDKSNKRWAGQYDALSSMEMVVDTSTEVFQTASTIKSMEIGSAIIQACGPNSLHSVFDFYDPASRANPRLVNNNHVRNLFNDVWTANNKRDHEFPIYFAIAPEHIDAELREKMASSDVKDPTQMPPILVLLGVTDREVKVAKSIWSHYDLDLDIELSPERRSVLLAELQDLRSKRPRLLLLNGNHRLHILHKRGVQLAAEYSYIIERTQGRELTEQDMADLELVKNRIIKAFWRAIILDLTKLTEAARAQLICNQVGAIQMGMSPGEYFWWARGVIYAMKARTMTENPKIGPVELRNQLFLAWRRSGYFKDGIEEATADDISHADSSKGNKEANEPTRR